MPKRGSAAQSPLVQRFQQFLTLGQQAKTATDRAALIKTDLMSHATEHGELDEEKGHKVVLLPEPITVGDKTFKGFMRQKKAGSTSFNEEKAEEVCAEKNIPEKDYISYDRYVDQDKIARLYADDVLTDEEFNGFIEHGEPTYAFVPVKA